MQAAMDCVKQAAGTGLKQAAMREQIAAVVAQPTNYANDPVWGQLANSLAGVFQAQARFVGRDEPAPWRQWGDGLEDVAIEQMANACKLPVTVAGALMPDAHHGYGLPIGGVLAVENAVIPYGVGVDIGCRMCLSIFNIPRRRPWATAGGAYPLRPRRA